MFMTGHMKNERVQTITSSCGYGLLMILLATFAGTARADILYNSLNGTPSTDLGTFAMGAQGPQGDSFSTSASGLLLTDVFLKLQGVQDGASFTVALYTDDNTTCTPACTGGPGALLYSIAAVADNSLSTSMADYDFTLSAPQLLTANTRYWIVGASSNNSGTLWSYTEDLSGVGVAGEFDIDTYGLGPVSNEPYQMEVAGNTMPEPGPEGLLAIALATVGIARLRKRAQSKLHGSP
jgi:hypothetical protein